VCLQRAAVAFEEPGEGDLVGVHHRLRPRLPALLIGPSVEAWDRDEIAAAGMGAPAAVVRGSHDEPQLIVLRYEPPDARRESAERVVDVATLTCGAVTVLGFTDAALFVITRTGPYSCRPRRSSARARIAAAAAQEYAERMRSRIATSSAPRRSGRESRDIVKRVSRRNRPACRQTQSAAPAPP
jgi:hypothetical protein